MAGQLGVFFLLGVTLFLLLLESRPLLAGAALLPCSLKPHLFLPVVVVLILWSVWRRAPRVLLGFVGAVLVSNVVVWCFDPHIWSQYREMMATTGLHDRFAPTLAGSCDCAWRLGVFGCSTCRWRLPACGRAGITGRVATGGTGRTTVCL